MNKLDKALIIAQTESVATPPNSVVLYSISYQPTDNNKKAALQYMKSHTQSYMLDNTPCGQKLISMGLETDNQNPPEQLLKIWAIASERFIMAAIGSITAFVDNADPRSTFVSVELPLILKNHKIKQINGIDKFVFAQQFIQK